MAGAVNHRGRGDRAIEDTITFWQAAFHGSTVKRAIRVGLIVGTVLTAINQGDALLAGAGLDWVKVVLTYLVPYSVSTHGTASAAKACGGLGNA